MNLVPFLKGCSHWASASINSNLKGETMAFHITNFGSFGGNLEADINGFVPTAETGPWELTYDHGMEETHDSDGNLTEYGEWWEEERFPEIKAEAIKATEEAEEGISEWRQS